MKDCNSKIKNFKFLIVILSFAFFIFNFLPVFADYTPLMSLPGLETMPGESLLAQYLSWLFRFALAAAAFLAVLQITIGGIQMIFGGASETARTSAKKRIQDAIWGLVLALGSVLILTTISTQFENMKLEIPMITVKVEKSVTPKYSSKWVCPKYYGEPGDYSVEGEYDNQGECESSCVETCLPPSISVKEWEFDSGIKNQIGDASGSLNSLLSCMRKYLDSKSTGTKTVGRISSISDKNYIGKVTDCDKSSCCESGCLPVCQHTCQSCHYGGGEGGGKSYAVDFGDEENKGIIEEAAKKCGAGYFLDEKNHVHISTADCKKK